MFLLCISKGGIWICKREDLSEELYAQPGIFWIKTDGCPYRLSIFILSCEGYQKREKDLAGVNTSTKYKISRMCRQTGLAQQFFLHLSDRKSG